MMMTAMTADQGHGLKHSLIVDLLGRPDFLCIIVIHAGSLRGLGELFKCCQKAARQSSGRTLILKQDLAVSTATLNGIANPTNVMPKLSEYVEIAATEYFQETGEVELDSVWLAEFFQDGVQDDFPRQNLIAFHNLVQKALNRKAESAGKQARSHISNLMRKN